MTDLKKLIVLSVVLLSTAFVSIAADSVEYGIIIDKTDGSNAYIKFSERPIITFSVSEEIVISTSGATIYLPLSEVRGYRTGDVPSSENSSIIENVVKSPEITVDQNEITVRNAENTILAIYTPSGIQVGYIAVEKDKHKMDISSLVKGVYILKINDLKAFKFYKR